MRKTTTTIAETPTSMKNVRNAPVILPPSFRWPTPIVRDRGAATYGLAVHSLLDEPAHVLLEKSSARIRSSTRGKNEILVSWLGMKGLEPSTFCTRIDKLGLRAPKKWQSHRR